MASVSDDGLSNENMKKRLPENGCHSLYLGIIPNYKVRKVSAVRDFPPGCGRNALKTDLNREENVILPTSENMGNIVLANDMKDSHTEIGSQSTDEAVDCLVKLEQGEKLDRLVGEVVASTFSAIKNGVEEEISDAKLLGSELPKDLENSQKELSKDTEGIQCGVLVEGVDKDKTFPLVENVGAEHKTFALEMGIASDGPSPVSEVKTWSSPEQLIENSRVKEHVSVLPKNKCRKRRVSALRDFPPFCGTNAPKPTKQDCIGVTEAINNVVEFDMTSMRNEVIDASRDVMEAGSLHTPSEEADTLRERDIASPKDRLLEQKMMVCSEEQEGVHDDYDGRSQVKRTVAKSETMTKKQNEDASEVVGKEIVVYSRDGSLKTTSVSYTLGPGNEIIRPIVQGLITEPYCSPKQGKHKSSGGAVSGNEIVVVSQDKSDQTETAVSATGSGHEIVRPIVQGLMAEQYCPWRQGKQASLDGTMTENLVEKPNESWRKRSKAVARKSNPKPDFPRKSLGKKKSGSVGEATDELSNALITIEEKGSGLLAARNDGAYGLKRKALTEDPLVGQGRSEFDVTLPPFGPNNSSHGDARSKVRETLRLFQAICRKLLQGEESKSKPEEGKPRQASRIDLQAAKIIKAKGKEVNTGQHILGEVPGVEVGDEFQYRVELAIVGVHRLYQAGIDYMKHGGMLVAISIVSSGAYDDDVEDGDVLIYSGQGGNLVGKDKNPEDQKLERGNLALKNSISVRNPLRVIRGSKETKTSESVDSKGKVVTTYVYDGLYTVENYWTEQGPHGKMVFMFKLVRVPGQPELAWKEVKSSKKSKVRHGVCVHDITEGKETLPVSAVNTIDGEKPPPFNYIKKMIYPDWFHPSPPKGCDCVGRCSDSKKCSCAVKNGGEIPYNRNGAIVEVKPLVYECGPSCKCPPSCYNRVSQHGIKIPLEIFKTNSRGWGVRALTSIPSGTFICEYAGELLEDKEAERRIGNDEYLFDIGQNYSDCSVNSSAQAELSEVVEEVGYTIDAAQYGNVGRFINHSCSPNLYAQNVIYDHEDKRMPHIMLFAADNIPPLKELTYHYNYSVDQVRDSEGNIKVKNCFCGSSECTGRMY